MSEMSEMEKGLYFVHGYYMGEMQEINHIYPGEIYRDRLILMQDSLERVFDVRAYDLSREEARINEEIRQGDFVLFDGEGLLSAADDPMAIMYGELDRQLSNTISYENYGNQPEEPKGEITECYSYHVNVGHGNCSIVVFRENDRYHMWMVDCSIYDFTNRKRYDDNLDACLDYINDHFGIDTISKLLITHLHYDHINGIEHLMATRRIDSDTEIWMNTQYPWSQPTYSRIRLRLMDLGVKFIDPVAGNSTRHIKILYPTFSFNAKSRSPGNNINNASVLYQICFSNKRMLFTGDIETEGWDKVLTCYPHLCSSTYFCISHHGSLTGHIRGRCPWSNTQSLANCAAHTKLQILMGRDNAYRGIYSKQVLSDFNSRGHIVKTEDADSFVEIDWQTDQEKLI